MITRYVVVILFAATVLAACTQAPPAPVPPQSSQKDTNKVSQKDNIHINHTGW
jgi:hypothetical protein